MSVENEMYDKSKLLALFLVPCFTSVLAVAQDDPVTQSKKALLREVTQDLSVRSMQCVIYLTNRKHSQKLLSGLSVPIIFLYYSKKG